MTREQIDYLRGLQARPGHWGGCGALLLSPDPRDWSVRELPGMAGLAVTALPPAVNLGTFVGTPIYNQGNQGACVAFSTAGVCSLDTAENNQGWVPYDAEKLYTEAGGTGQNGVDSRLVLNNCVSLGTPREGGARVKVIASYAFVPQDAGQFTLLIQACLALGYPVTLALMLPSDFGWESGQPNAAETSGYHQVVIIGYYVKGGVLYFKILNSWGGDWPGRGAPNGAGIGSIRADYCTKANLQAGFCFAYTTTRVAGGPPVPPPVAMTVTGYQPNPVGLGGVFHILGQGFGPNVTAKWGGMPLQMVNRTATDLTAMVPGVAGQAAVGVTSGGPAGGQTAVGPTLTVQSNPRPPVPPPVPPPSGVTITLQSPPIYQRALVSASLRGPAGGGVTPGTVVEVTVTEPSGATGSAKLVLA